MSGTRAGGHWPREAGTELGSISVKLQVEVNIRIGLGDG